MLGLPGVSSASRHLARPASGIEHEIHFPQLKNPRGNSIHAKSHVRGDLRVRRVREESERVKHFLLLRAEIVGGDFVCK